MGLSRLLSSITIAPILQPTMFRVLAFLPILTTAKIEVNIIGRNEGQDPIEVYLSGESVYPITNSEIITFQLTDAYLKEGVKAYLGHKPDEVFLKNPTRLGSLYTQYGWKPVMRAVNASKATIVSMEAVNRTLLRQVFENGSSSPVSFNVGVAKTITNSMIAKWQSNTHIKGDEPISYTFDTKKLTGEWHTILSHKANFGHDFKQTHNAQVGPTSAMQIVLQPGQSAKTTLFATLTTVNIDIEYTSRLRGRIIANYAKLFNGHHFWSCDVAAVINNVGMPYMYTSRQTIQVMFYWNVRVIVRDGGSNKKLMEVQY